MASHLHPVVGEGERLAGRHPKLHLHQVDPGDQLGDRVLHLQASVHLQVIETPVLVEELHRAGVDVSAALRHRHCGPAHGLGRGGADPRGGGLLDQLLVAPLHRAVAGAQMQAAAVGVGQHLDLDVAGRGQVALQVELVAPEVGHGLAPSRLDGLRRLRGVQDHLHAPAASAVGRFHGHRPAVSGAEGLDLARPGDRLVGAGHPGHAGRGGRPAGGDLVAHDLHGLGPGADEGRAGLGHRPGKTGVLAEEPVAGVNRLGPAAAQRGQNRVGVEVALGRGAAAQGVGLVGQADVQGVPIQFGVDGYGADAHLSAGPDDPDGDLAPVGDQDLGEHGSNG